MITLPFLARGDRVGRDAWRVALAQAMPDYRIVDFDDLTEHEKSDARVALVANPDPAQLNQLPNLIWVHSLWADVERLLAELPPSEVNIVRLTDPVLSDTMAEAVLALTFYLHRDMPAYRDQQLRGVWHQRPFVPASQRTVAVLGLGVLGAAAAGRLVANRFDVVGWSRSPRSVPGVECYHGNDGLQVALSKADIVVVLLPQTSATIGLLDATRLGHIRPGAGIINLARGPIIDTDALVAALDRGHLSHAVLDVFDREPLPPESLLWRHRKITILPHVAAPTNKQTASAIVAANIQRFFADGTIPPSVDRLTGY
jgi:glyoxylate/hydroxypyruvate reductase